MVPDVPAPKFLICVGMTAGLSHGAELGSRAELVDIAELNLQNGERAKCDLFEGDRSSSNS